MSLAEALETTCIHRVAGLTGARTALVTTRPCRAPPQMISAVGLIGGGHIPMPGEVSLAHHGMLFLNERPEFRCYVREFLRQPLKRASQKHDLSSVIGLVVLGALRAGASAARIAQLTATAWRCIAYSCLI
jgi:hypothetical protein